MTVYNKVWDKCVLTATNEKQAIVYRFQLQRLKRAGVLHPETEYLVIPDPNGVRVGSGGATLHVLRYLKSVGQEANGINSRLLILHSGGDSRRIPYQSLLGKAFASLPPPMNSIFEVMSNFLTSLGAQIDAGIVVACGDTWMQLNASDASSSPPDAITLPKDSDVTGVVYWGSPELGSRHGVYDVDPDTGEVRRCLHKYPAERLRKAGVYDPDGRVAIDTGVLLFRPTAVMQLQSLANQFTKDIYVDLYGDMLPAMVTQTERHQFTSKYPFLRNSLWETLSALRFSVYSPPSLEFTHTGTTREYLELIKHPIKAHTSISCQVPLNEERWVNLTYGVTDVPTVCGDEATLFGESIPQWLRQHELTPDVIWHKEQVANASQRCLWNACLYPIYRTDDPDVTFSISIEDSVKYPDWFQNPCAEWRNSERLSMAEIMSRADRVKAFVQQQQTEALKVATSIVEMVETETDIDVRPLLRSILTPYGYQRAMSVFDEVIGRIENPLHRARLHKIAADLCIPFIETPPLNDPIPVSLPIGKPPELTDYKQKRDYHYTQAFAAVREAVSKSIVTPPMQMLHNQRSVSDISSAVTVHLPVRVDLAGGWTDTPPISLEKGGAVLNVALLLNGRYPISVTARRIPEPVIRLKSVDQKKEVEFHDSESFKTPIHLNDPLALHRTVLDALGLLTVSNNTINIRGSTPDSPGLELVSHCDVPMGSGLGTSSILAGGLVKALWQLIGVQWTDEALFNQVLVVEQMLTSGGGWQDQVGGIVPGWKLTTTEPGMPQRFSVEQIVLAHDTSEALEEQLLLVYTGQQRVAKNILEQVVADWLSRREDLVATLTQLRSDAYLMRDALVAGDIEQFGNLLTRYWEGKKVLNPDTTNPTIDTLLKSVSDLCSGYGIAGAGGGGFLVLLAKDAAARSQIEERLAHTQAIIYPWQVAT